MKSIQCSLIYALIWSIQTVSSFCLLAPCGITQRLSRSSPLFVIGKKQFARDPLGDNLVNEKRARYEYLLKNHQEYGLRAPVKDFEDDTDDYTEETEDGSDEAVDDDDEDSDNDDGHEELSYEDIGMDPLDILGEQEGDFKSGFVTITGNPNVGKSSLMNSLLKEKLSIVTPKPQTTRHRILGILSDPSYQLVFSDTPGMLKGPSYKLQESMQKTV